MFEGVGKLQCSHLNSCWNGPSSHPQTFFWGLALRAQAESMAIVLILEMMWNDKLPIVLALRFLRNWWGTVSNFSPTDNGIWVTDLGWPSRPWTSLNCPVSGSLGSTSRTRHHWHRSSALALQHPSWPASTSYLDAANDHGLNIWWGNINTKDILRLPQISANGGHLKCHF